MALSRSMKNMMQRYNPATGGRSGGMFGGGGSRMRARALAKYKSAAKMKRSGGISRNPEAKGGMVQGPWSGLTGGGKQINYTGKSGGVMSKVASRTAKNIALSKDSSATPGVDVKSRQEILNQRQSEATGGVGVSKSYSKFLQKYGSGSNRRLVDKSTVSDADRGIKPRPAPIQTSSPLSRNKNRAKAGGIMSRIAQRSRMARSKSKRANNRRRGANYKGLKGAVAKSISGAFSR